MNVFLYISVFSKIVFSKIDCFFHFAVFFSRHNISLKAIGGERKSVTKQIVAPWSETTLPKLFSKYDLIFNAGEFGLIYQCLPNKTFHFKGQKFSGGKNSKVILTGMTAGNAIGEKLPMFVLGKYKTLRCFKHIKNLPCKYKSQKKSWMNKLEEKLHYLLYLSCTSICL